MDLLDPRVARHLDDFVPPRPPELARMEESARRSGFPIIGPAAGQFCYLVARTLGARRIFELGSGFGYSTAWFARAVVENGGGEVHHVVWDEDLSKRARGHLSALGFTEVVRYHVEEAITSLRGQEGTFDLIFCDIDKEGYPDALPVIQQRLRSGGILLVDNLLWSGRIFDEDDRSAATVGVRELTRGVRESEAWEATLAPIRDGILFARRR